MDLEQRVTELEQEVQVLKSQIQAILLDIQEQVLTNTYPNLRAEGAIAEPPGRNPGPIRTVSLSQDDMADTPPEPAESGMPRVRKVSLNDLQNAEPRVAPARNCPEPPPPSPKTAAEPAMPSAAPVTANRRRDAGSAHPNSGGSRQLNGEEVARLKQWVIRKLEKHGLSATEDLIKSYVANQRIPEELEPVLLRHAARQAARVAAPPPSPPASQPSAPPPAPDRDLPDFMEDEDDERTNVVLRLIAGIQNAGVGKWRK
jgi:hypothetical protein